MLNLKILIYKPWLLVEYQSYLKYVLHFGLFTFHFAYTKSSL